VLATGLGSPSQRSCSRLLARSLAGCVAHDAHWFSQIASLLSGRPAGEAS
jgi:hypothetical protein